MMRDLGGAFFATASAALQLLLPVRLLRLSVDWNQDMKTVTLTG